MFSLLGQNQKLVKSSQGLFCFFYCHTGEEAGGARRLGGDTAGTDDLSWPKEYSRLSDIVLSI